MRLADKDQHVEELRAMRAQCGDPNMQDIITIFIAKAEQQPVVLDTTQAPTYGGNLDLLPHKDVVKYCNDLYLSLVMVIKERDKLQRKLDDLQREAKKEE